MKYFSFLHLFLVRFQDFEIKDTSPEYLALHPMGSKKQTSLVNEHFEHVMSDDDQSLSDASTSSQDEPANGISLTYCAKFVSIKSSCKPKPNASSIQM